MDQELLSYYESELRFLRAMGAEFARRFPMIAGRLQLEEDKCEDPHVERMIEGCALLTARIRKKLDDEYPEITAAMLEMLYPHLLRPQPSMSIAQFLPIPNHKAMANGYRIDPGTIIVSESLEKAECRFRTVYPVQLWPLELSVARLLPDRVGDPAKPPGASALLQWTLNRTTDEPIPPNFDRLRIFLDGEAITTFSLFELLLIHVRKIVLRGRGEDGVADDLVLPVESLRPVGFELDEGMVPYPNRSFPGYRLLEEYFGFPQKFLFFDLHGLEAVAKQNWTGAIEVLFFLDEVPGTLTEVSPSNFRLGCSPVVNLFELTADPIILDQVQHEYRVIGDVQRPDTTEIYSVDSVHLASSFMDDPVLILPFHAPSRPSEQDRPSEMFWTATRRPSPRRGDAGTEIYLSLVDPTFQLRHAVDGVLTARVTASNRDLPSKLPFGGDQGTMNLEASGPIGRVRLLTKPTPTRRPQSGRLLHWRLISTLSLNHLSLVDSAEGLDALRLVLQLHDPTNSAITRQQIDGIVRASGRQVAGRIPGRVGIGNVGLGQEISLTFDEDQYVGSGAVLLAAVLERFFGMYSTINSFTQLVAKTQQREGVLKRWPPRAGARPVL